MWSEFKWGGIESIIRGGLKYPWGVWSRAQVSAIWTERWLVASKGKGCWGECKEK